MKLRDFIAQTTPDENQIAIFYLAQAGFVFKTHHGPLITMDPYFSDSAEHRFGFKRMIPPLISPGELQPDILVNTHSHVDHLDPDALSALKSDTDAFFIGATDCRDVYLEAGLAESRFALISEEQKLTHIGVEFKGVFADHGDLAPDAIGISMYVAGLHIYNAGDTAFRPSAITKSLEGAVDVMIAPINGAFGNLDAKQACMLAEKIKPKVLIASHFGMFIDHGGLPIEFLKEAKNLPEGITPIVLAPGERLLMSSNDPSPECLTLKTGF